MRPIGRALIDRIAFQIIQLRQLKRSRLCLPFFQMDIETTEDIGRSPVVGLPKTVDRAAASGIGERSRQTDHPFLGYNLPLPRLAGADDDQPGRPQIEPIQLFEEQTVFYSRMPGRIERDVRGRGIVRGRYRMRCQVNDGKMVNGLQEFRFGGTTVQELRSRQARDLIRRSSQPAELPLPLVGKWRERQHPCPLPWPLFVFVYELGRPPV